MPLVASAEQYAGRARGALDLLFSCSAGGSGAGSTLDAVRDS